MQFTRYSSRITTITETCRLRLPGTVVHGISITALAPLDPTWITLGYDEKVTKTRRYILPICLHYAALKQSIRITIFPNYLHEIFVRATFEHAIIQHLLDYGSCLVIHHNMYITTTAWHYIPSMEIDTHLWHGTSCPNTDELPCSARLIAFITRLYTYKIPQTDPLGHTTGMVHARDSVNKSHKPHNAELSTLQSKIHSTNKL